MSVLLGELVVPPAYAQVSVECEGATDLPVPETGTERAVATAQAVLVATRGDDQGDVRIEVWLGPASESSGFPVFDGEINCPTPRLVFGNALANVLSTAEIETAGWVPLQIYVDPPEAPSTVRVFVAR